MDEPHLQNLHYQRFYLPHIRHPAFRSIYQLHLKTTPIYPVFTAQPTIFYHIYANMSSSNYCSKCCCSYEGTSRYHQRTTHSVAMQVQYMDMSTYTLRRNTDGAFACIYCNYISSDSAKLTRHCTKCAASSMTSRILCCLDTNLRCQSIYPRQSQLRANISTHILLIRRLV